MERNSHFTFQLKESLRPTHPSPPPLLAYTYPHPPLPNSPLLGFGRMREGAAGLRISKQCIMHRTIIIFMVLEVPRRGRGRLAPEPSEMHRLASD